MTDPVLTRETREVLREVADTLHDRDNRIFSHGVAIGIALSAIVVIAAVTWLYAPWL